MEHSNNYNYESIRNLCEIHFEDIKARKDLKHILGGKNVRYVDQEGHFGYAKFGDFYFDDNGVMMLFGKEFSENRYHRPDCFKDTYLSTIPVLYAGVEIGLKDDTYNPIYTGDVLTLTRGLAKYTLMARWLEWSKIPGLMADNHEVLFQEGDKFHIEGNVFYSIEETDFETYDVWKFVGHNGELLRPSNDGWYDFIMDKIKEAPRFSNSPSKLPSYSHIYDTEWEEYSELPNDRFVSFVEDREYDPEDEETYPILFLDRFPGLPEDIHVDTIEIDEYHPDWDKVKHLVEQFILDAHNDPKTRYILLDYYKTINFSPVTDKIDELFRPIHDYKIPNIVIPARIMFKF